MCSEDEWCCDQADSICAGLAADLCEPGCCGDGICFGNEDPGTCPADCAGPVPPAPGCCTASDAPGCPGNLDCEEVVCGEDPFCCEAAWDEICEGLALEFCGGCCGDGVCGEGENPENCEADCEPPAAPVEACCLETGEPGCPGSPLCEAAVCAFDSFCCESAWDQICAGAATDTCGACCGDGVCDDVKTRRTVRQIAEAKSLPLCTNDAPGCPEIRMRGNRV